MKKSSPPDATIDLVLTGDTSNEPTEEDFFYDLLKPVKYAVDNNLGSSNLDQLCRQASRFLE